MGAAVRLGGRAKALVAATQSLVLRQAQQLQVIAIGVAQHPVQVEAGHRHDPVQGLELGALHCFGQPVVRFFSHRQFLEFVGFLSLLRALSPGPCVQVPEAASPVEGSIIRTNHL